jgi:hypothetical protein
MQILNWCRPHGWLFNFCLICLPLVCLGYSQIPGTSIRFGEILTSALVSINTDLKHPDLAQRRIKGEQIVSAIKAKPPDSEARAQAIVDALPNIDVCGRYVPLEQMKELFEEALTIREKHFGPYSDENIAPLKGLVDVCSAQADEARSNEIGVRERMFNKSG